MQLLSAPVTLHAECDQLGGRQHGQIDDVEKYVNDVITRYYRPTPGYLRPDDRAELLAQLFVVAVKCSEDYDPTKGIGFRTYVFRTCWNRITDWLRKRGGDRRYTPRPPEESLDESHDSIGDGGSAAFAALSDVAAIDTTGLTPESVMTIERIVRPMLEHGTTLEELEKTLGRGRRELNRLLAQLRRELEVRDPALKARSDYYRRKRAAQKAAKEAAKQNAQMEEVA